MFASALSEARESSEDGFLKATTWVARIALLTLVHTLSKDLDALKGGHNGATVDVIIQFRQTPSDAHHQRLTVGKGQSGYQQCKGGVLKDKLDFIKGAHYSVPTESLDALANDPDVAYISPDRPLSGSLDYVTSAVGAPVAWNVYGLDGTGIGVAIIDSGVHNLNDFKDAAGKNRVLFSQDFVGGGTDDFYGHGTHVTGIVGSTGKGSTCPTCTRTFKGVAPNASFINLRVLDKNGAGTDSRVINAIQRAISLKNTYNIRVINLSLGRPVYESYTLDPLCQAVEQAWKAGIVVVVAAGNQGRNDSAGTNGYGTISAPGNDPYAITVGAMKTNGTYSTVDDTIATYSSKGPTGYDQIVKPDLVAPGNRVVSDMNGGATTLPSTAPLNWAKLAYYQNTTNTGNSPQYFALSGTSMATPVVSGAAALLLQQYPSLTPDQVKARLMKTASKNFPASSTVTDPSTGITYSDYYEIFTIGAGYLNIPAALANNDLADASAMSPSAYFDQNTQTVYLIEGTGVVWGSGVVWGNSLVWGTSVVWGNSVVWGSSVVWASSGCSGFSVVWGTGVVWGASSDQSNSNAQSIRTAGED